MFISATSTPSFWRPINVLFSSILLTVSSAAFGALPSGHEVIHGDITVTQNGHLLQIDQLSPQAIAHWQQFSIGADQTVNIFQPGADSVLLNRVLGADPSRLMGQLNANGQVYLINPNGIVVGENARVDTSAFIASALDITNAEFLEAGDLTFSGDSEASVVNFGQITGRNGDVILIAHQVRNEGLLSAENGVVGLAAGQSVVFMPESDQRLFVRTSLGESSAHTGVDNQGVIEAAQAELKAAGGNIYELAINQAGVVRATGVVRRDGRVLLTSDGGRVAHSGQIQASNADGSGGEVLIGGDYLGQNPDVSNAASTFVSETGVIDVSATADSGDAGRAIVWADEGTRFLGRIEGRGGDLGGDGAFAEVSGKRHLDFQGVADLSAPLGTPGTLLLDPAAITIQATGSDTVTETPGDPFAFGSNDAEGSILLVSTLEAQLALSDVIVQTSLLTDDETDLSIVINDPISWSSISTLDLRSAGGITVNADITAELGIVRFGLGFLPGFLDSGTIPPNPNLIVSPAATVTADVVNIGRFDSGQFFGNVDDGPMGGVLFEGTLIAGNLILRYPESRRAFLEGGIAGPILIENPANRISRMDTFETGGILGADISIFSGSDSFTIDGQLLDVEGDVTIVSRGDLFLGQEAVIRTHPTGGGDITLVSTEGNFINLSVFEEGAIVLGDSSTQRFLIYSGDPDDTVRGKLAGAPIYDRTFAANAPSSIPRTGNRFLYRFAPVLQLIANNASRDFGQPNPTFSFRAEGLVTGDALVDVFTGTPALSTEADLASPLGDYAISIALGTVELSDFNYGLELVPGTLSIVAGALPGLTVKADDFVRFFGDDNPDFTATFTGLLGDDQPGDFTGLVFTTTATQMSPVGNYTITPSGLITDRYVVAYEPGNLRIDPRLVTVRAVDLEKVFGEPLPPFELEFLNLPFFTPSSALGTITATSFASFTTTGVGEYAIELSGGSNPNFIIDLVDGTATVNPRPATIVAPTLSRSFGEANPALVAAGRNFIGADFQNSMVTLTDVPIEANVGDYVIEVSGFSNPNYDVTFFNGLLSVTPAQITLTADSFDRLYGDPNPTFTFTDTGYRLSDTRDDVFSSIALSAVATPASPVGLYQITFDFNRINDNYTVNASAGQLRVDPAPATVIALPATRIFGDPNPAFEFQVAGLRNDDTADVVTGVVFQALASEQFDVGSYPLEILSATASNYSLSFTASTLTITPRPLTITANNATREYGDENPAFTASFDNLASFHTADSINGLTFSTPATPASNPLVYSITPSAGSNPNYNITFEQGFLTVTKAPLSIGFNDVARFFGDNNTLALGEVTLAFADGFKLNDDISAITISNFSSTATPTSDVGTYPIMQDISSVFYEVTVDLPAYLIVNPRPINLLLDLPVSERNRVYGDPVANFANNLIVGNLASFDTANSVVQIIDPTAVNSPIGEYSLQANLLSQNYEIQSFANNNFFVTPRLLNVSVEDSFGVFGDNVFNANLSITGDGLAFFDQQDDVFRLTSLNNFDQNTLPGYYLLNNFSLDNPNYLIDFTPGVLTILPRPVGLNIQNQTLILNTTQELNEFLNGEGLVVNASITNARPGDTIDDIFPTIRYQIVRSDSTPRLPIVPTPDNVLVPTIEELIADASLIGSGINLRGSIITPIDPPLQPLRNLPGSAQGRVEGFITVLDGFNTDSRYVLASVNNGEADIQSSFIVTAVNSDSQSNNRLVIDTEAFRQNMENLRTNLPPPQTTTPTPQIVVGSVGDPPPSIENLLKADNYALGIEMVMNLVRDLMGPGEIYDFDEDSILFQILGKSPGSLEDFTPAQIQRFFERNANNPDFMALLAAPLSHYASSFLERNPATYTPMEASFASFFSQHLTHTRNQIAEGMQQQFEQWKADNRLTTGGMQALFGLDVPWGQFIADAAGDYVAENIALKMGAAAAAGSVSLAASYAAITTAANAILPFAKIATSMTLSSAVITTGAVATGPAAIVASTVVGSIARGVLVAENEEQRQAFEQFNSNLSRSVQPHNFSVAETGDPVGDMIANVNETVLLSAITNMFYTP
jgi:filamentous hemagglutinin family protein